MSSSNSSSDSDDSDEIKLFRTSRSKKFSEDIIISGKIQPIFFLNSLLEKLTEENLDETIEKINIDSDFIYEELVKKNIFVKKYNKENILSNFLRVTVSNHKINNILINELRNIIWK